MGIYSPKTKALKEKMKQFSVRYEGYYILQCALEKLTEDFRKYAKNFNGILYVELSEIFGTTKVAVERNLRTLMLNSNTKYKNYKLKEFLLELSLEIMEEISEKRYKEDE